MLVHQAEQALAGGAQPLREHQHQLHEDLGAEQRLLDDDARQALAMQHGDLHRAGGDASGEARLAVDHRHLAQRAAGLHGGEELRRVPAVALVHLDLALQHHQHEVTAVAFADDLHARVGAVHVHEVRQQPHFAAGKVLQQPALRDERVHLLGEPGGVAEGLEVRELLWSFRHACAADYAGIRSPYRRLRRLRTPSARLSSTLIESSHPRQPSVTLWPNLSGLPSTISCRPSTRFDSTITPTTRFSPPASCAAISDATSACFWYCFAALACE